MNAFLCYINLKMSFSKYIAS